VSQKSQKVKGHEEQDWPLAPNPQQPPPGKYTVAYRKARMVKRFQDRYTVELHFSVIEPIEWFDTPLVMYCSVPLTGYQGEARNMWRCGRWRTAANQPNVETD